MHPAGQLFQTPGHTFSRACRDLSVDTPIGRWNLVEAQPAADMADTVECYWEGWGDMPPLVEKLMPRTSIELMFNLKGRHSLLELDGKVHGSNHAGGWLSGLQRWRLLREPMHAVSCRVPLLDEIWGDAIHSVAERLQAAPNLYARFDLLESHLRAKLDIRTRIDTDVVEAARRVLASLGLLRIDSLCHDLGTSRVTLGRKFREQVGLTPKVYARVVRIGAVMTRLDLHGSDDWAMLAEDFGYHDQAHLAHDFQEFCGASPGAYLRRAAPGGGATLEDPR